MTFVSDTISIKYMMKNQYKKRTFLVTIPHILISVLSVIGIVILKDYKYMGRIIPYVLVTAIVSSMFLISTFIKGKKMINIEYWKYGLTLSIPLVLHGVSMTILAHSDKIMITKIVGADQTGIYSLIYNLSMLVTVFSASLDGVWIPWFTRSMQSNNVITINKNVKRYIEIMIIVVCGLLLVSPEIIKILADKAYWVGMKMIPPIILASFIMYLYTIEVHIEYYYKATKSIAFNTCTAAGVNLLLNIIFIPTFGAIAAAYTTLFAYFVSFIMHYKKARKLDNRIISFNNYIVPILVASLAAVLMYVLLDYFLVRWILTIVAFLIYIMFAYKSKRYEKFLN
jgi:O-antigen/teichoic acid export membrane protein